MSAVLLVLLGIVVCAALTFTRLRRGAAATLLVLALLWLPVNTPVEGRTLVVLSYNHGITEADVLTVLAVLWAATALAVHYRQR